MKRFQYKLNDETLSGGGFGSVIPLKAIDVVPGDTLEGTLSHKAYSDLMNRFITTRTYFDLYAFYVPYRVVWEDFPIFIADAEAKTMPTTTVNAPELFMRNPGGDTISAMLQRAYRMIFYSFFYPNENATRDREMLIDQVKSGAFDSSTGLGTARARPTTFDLKVRQSANFDETLVVNDKTVGADTAFSVEQLRSAMAQDRFQRMRDFYGARYTDYLAAVGVKATWSVLDEPECLAVSNNDWKATETRSSTSTSGEDAVLVGQKFGQFQGEYKTRIPRTFCPEHGVVMVVCAARSDVFNARQGYHTVCAKTDRSQFYSPEFSFELSQEWPAKVVDHNLTGEVVTPRFEDYRCGRNEWNGIATNAKTYAPFSAVGSVGDIGHLLGTLINPAGANVFVGELGDQVQVYTETRMTRRSPVPPTHRKVGI